MPSFSSRFLYVVGEKRKELILMLFLFLFLSSLEFFSIGIVGPFVSIATNPNLIQENQTLNSIFTGLNFKSPFHFLVFLGLVLIVVFYSKATLAFYIQKSIFEFGFNLRRDISLRLMAAYMSAPYTFHLASNSATLINNVVTEAQSFCTGLLMSLLTSISNAMVILALVLLLMKTDLLATVLISLVLFIAFAIFSRFKEKLYQWGVNASEANIAIIKDINHGLGGIKETRIIGCESHFLDQLNHDATFYAENVSAAVSFNNLPRFMIEALLMTFLVGFTTLFLLFHEGSGNLVAVLGVFALASVRLMPAASGFFSSVGTISGGRTHMDRLYHDLNQLEGTGQNSRNRSVQIKKTVNQSSTLRFELHISLEHVRYTYPNSSTPSLKDISIVINKGESIGLIGKSGAGKTTLIDVILGLLTPQGGDISVDGISIYNDLRSWQNMLGYVPQSIFLIDDTLAHNIAFGVPDELIDYDRLDNAVKTAQLSELVAHLPNGLQTEVGERGVLLSGGQRQRIGIARAIYHEREILVFDEATSALDSETESFVTESIKALSGIKTMIIIAHRLSTIEHCDRIYAMEKGRIVKYGSYQDVVLSGQNTKD